MAVKPKPKKPAATARPVRPAKPEALTGDLDPAAPKKPKPAPVEVVEPPPVLPTARAFSDPVPAPLEPAADPGGRPVDVTTPGGERAFAQTPVHRAPCDPPSRT